MPHLITPAAALRLADLPTRADGFHNDRESAESAFKQLRRELIDLQNILYAEGKQSLLIVLQAMDAGGKDGTIRKVFRGVNPQGVKVSSFKAPTSEELSHDFLWRVHAHAPARGMIAVFNRSHYEDVLITRVEKMISIDECQSRYAHINHFEQLLVDSGTRILKFYLHISPAEQKKRFQERLDRPEKHWKFDLNDLKKRNDWDLYMEAFERALENCSTETAPWYAIPADQKWYRNLAITRVIVDTLKQMNPQFPAADDLDGIVIT